MQIDEIKERLRILRNVQQTFIDVEEWYEVSKIQFDIDELVVLEAKAKRPKIEFWFKVAFMEFAFRQLQGDLAKIIYRLEWEEKLRNEKPS
jgi:hypothetical protein